MVLVQHRDIQDAESGGRYTVKIYESEKVAAGDSWEHVRIRLRPDTDIPGYRALEFDGEAAGELKVIAELVAVL